MRLIFSTNDHMNTDISDERGYIYYTVSTPFTFLNKVTTITKYRWNTDQSGGIPETMCTIEWHSSSQTVFQFGGKVILEDAMFEKHTWSRYVRVPNDIGRLWLTLSDVNWNGVSGRHFLGPDGHKYKWKLESTHCWMKPAESDTPLVRYHKRNLGIWKDAHPAYLDVSDNVVSMLDHIILTFVYVEWLRQKKQARRGGGAVMAGGAPPMSC